MEAPTARNNDVCFVHFSTESKQLWDSIDRGVIDAYVQSATVIIAAESLGHLQATESE